jgi:hypothetical protein
MRHRLMIFSSQFLSGHMLGAQGISSVHLCNGLDHRWTSCHWNSSDEGTVKGEKGVRLGRCEEEGLPGAVTTCPPVPAIMCPGKPMITEYE